MNNFELGRKIKEARLMKKMTQSEVVGSFITRNMLSQIESGIATPSIKTLEYLSNVLEIPISDLVSDSLEKNTDNTTQNIEQASIDYINNYINAKKLFSSNQYRKTIECLELISESDNFLSDEIYALLANSYYMLAKEYFDNNNYQNSIIYAKKASDISTKGIFQNVTLKTSCILLFNSIAEKIDINQ